MCLLYDAIPEMDFIVFRCSARNQCVVRNIKEMNWLMTMNWLKSTSWFSIHIWLSEKRSCVFSLSCYCYCYLENSYSYPLFNRAGFFFGLSTFWRVIFSSLRQYIPIFCKVSVYRWHEMNSVVSDFAAFIMTHRFSNISIHGINWVTSD